MAKHVPSSGDVKNSFINRIDFSKKVNACYKGTEFFPETQYFNSDIFATRFRKPLIFHKMHYVKTINLSLKYQRCTSLGFKDIWIKMGLCGMNKVIFELQYQRQNLYFPRILLCYSSCTARMHGLYSIYNKQNFNS